MDTRTGVSAPSSEIPDLQHALGLNNRDDEDWEMVETEEHHQDHNGTSSKPTFGFTLHCEFALQRGAGSQSLQTHANEIPTAHTSTTKSFHEQGQCQLFSLPFELRLRIYEEVLAIKSPSVQLKWHPVNSRRNLRPSVLSILETCRRIFVEAEPIFYSINVFQFPIKPAGDGTRFLQTIGSNRRDVIRSVMISTSSAAEALSVIQELTLLSKLKKLCIVRRQCVRYIDVRTWAVFTKQLKMQLEKFSQLQELEIITPETVTPTLAEEQRMHRLVGIDALLREVTIKQSNS